MTRREIFAEMFGELTTSEQVACYNEFADGNCYTRIESLDEYTINELFAGMSPWDIAWKLRDVDLQADYFMDDTYFETYYEGDIFSDVIEDRVDDIYDRDRFGEWIDEWELDNRCEEHIMEVLKENFPEVDEELIQTWIDEYYENEEEDDENIESFEGFLKENEETEDESDDEGDDK